MKGNYVGIIANDSPGLVAGLLGILKSGNSFVPISPAYPRDRIDFIIKDCGIKVLLADRANYEKAQQVADSNPIIEHLLCIDDQIPPKEIGRDTGNKVQDVDADEPCYLIYTSGSTGKPKGVPITHCNLIPLFSWFREYFDLGTHTRVMQNLSYTFDFGVFEILTTLLYGGCLYLLDKGSIGEFAFYSEFINRHLLNTVHSTPVFFSNLVSAAEEMPSLQLVHLGGERLTGKIVKNISQVVSPGCLIHNGYGPTEATINCSIFTLTAARAAEIEESIGIPIGHPTAWNILYILDKNFNPQPIGAAGELCVTGPGLAQGYLNRPELSYEKFCLRWPGGREFFIGSPCRGAAPVTPRKNFLLNTSQYLNTPLPHYPIYMTGDLTRWLPEGDIEFLGRIDFQVKVRGFRIELGEIENHLLKHPDIKETVVLAREHENGSYYLCAYFVADTFESLSVTRLREHLAADLPDYMIPAYFIPLEQMPLTTSGKVDRKRLPEPDESMINTGSEYEAPVTETEKKLVKIWQGLLKLEKIGVNDDFFELGGDSILANQCIARVREELEAEIPLRKFFEKPYIKALSGEIARKEQQAVSIPRGSREGLIPLSFAQERLWFLQELDTENVAYFVPRVIRIKGKIEKELFERTFTEIIRRHEILRTRFLTVEGLPVQHIDPPYEFRIPVIDCGGVEEPQQLQEVAEWLKEEGRRKFNFETGPMLRVTLLKLKPQEHLLVLTEHHLVHDGWTQGVLLREFVTIFTAYIQDQDHSMPELPIQYADFAIWQRQMMQGEVLENHLDYWENKLNGLPPVLELPLDRPRPAVISGAGELLNFHLSQILTNELIEFSRKNDVTLFMTMLAVFKVLLYRYSGVEDLCIGTGIANRRYKEMEGMLGMVINSLPLRTCLQGDFSFNHLLRIVKETCLEAYQHEDTPFGKIVETLQPERSLSYSPIFQVLYSFMDTPTADMQLPGLELELLESHNRSAKFDINIVVVPPGEQEETGETLIEWEYNTDIFVEETMNRMIAHYTRLLETIIKTPAQSIGLLDMLSEVEIQQLLISFNETAVDYPFDKTLHQLFEDQSERTPHGTALLGVHETYEKHEKNHKMSYLSSMTHLSYKELNKKSNQLAALLMQRGGQPDTIVGIMPGRSIEMIISILAILKAGCAYLPLDPVYPEERINYMLKDSNAKVLLAAPEAKVKTEVEEGSGHPQELPLQIVNTEKDFFNFSESASSTLTSTSRGTATAANLAYVIYTSGSTGKPKGVMVQHGNVVNFITGMTAKIDFRQDKRILGVTTITFDIFVLETWLPLTLGMQVVIADEEQRMDPGLLSEAIIRYNIDMLQVTPSRLSLLFNSDRQLNCLQGVEELIVGGEAFPAHLLDHLYEVYPGKLFNVYGPTETTVWSTLKELTASKTVTIGIPIANTQIYILDRYNCLQPIGAAGELLIGGHGVTRGYLNNPELTAEKFIYLSNRSYMSYKTYISKKIYKTGDLARWLSGGEIEFLGRIDYQVKVRGFRIELEEIENQLLKHEEIKEAVVMARESQDGDKYLTAYLVSNNGEEISTPVLREYLPKVLPNYMVPSYFVLMEEIPLTPSGKADRKALPLPEANSDVEYIAPRSEIERKLAGIWSEILSLPGHLSIGINDNFFLLGGHSLKATQAAAKIHKIFNVKLPLMQIFKRATIEKLARYIKEAAEDKYGAIEPVEKREYYPLSSAQRRLYILQHMDEPCNKETIESTDSTGANIAYNISTVLELDGEIQEQRLEEALKILITRHESLRTSFLILNGEPVQRIHEQVEFEIEYCNSGRQGDRETGNLLEDSGSQANREIGNDLSQKNPLSLSPSLPEHFKEFIRPFDLSTAPLLRVGLLGRETHRHLMMVDMHHVISDGISTGILAGEFVDIYLGRGLLPLRIQYKDYSQWQKSEQEKERLKKQEAWWLKEFSHEAPVLNLPLDYPRPAFQCFEGNRVVFETGAEELKALRKLALAEGVTLYMVLLAGYSILLSKLGGHEEVVIGAPAAARTHPDLESVIGMFVNTLTLRTYPQGHITCKEFLYHIKEKTLEAFENQEYPFEDLVEKTVSTRNASRNPLFDTVFILQNVEIPEMRMTGLTLIPSAHDNKISKFDLTLQAFEMETLEKPGSEGKLRFVLEYCIRLFKLETIRRFINYFKRILSGLIENPRQKISGLEIISEAEKREIVMEFNATAREYPLDKTIATLFVEQVEQAPDTIALVASEHITYTELNRKSSQLGHLLKERGVDSDTIVGIMGGRSIEMILGILGILKAGGAYLPLDPGYPEERITYILADSGTKVLLAEEGSAHPQGLHLQIVNIEKGIFSYSKSTSSTLTSTSTCEVGPANLAYVMYTSGSTGGPKGVMVTQRNVVRLVKETDYVELNPGTRILQTGAPVFDATTFEIWGSLLNGGQLVLADNEVILDARQLALVLVKSAINTLWLTSSLFNRLAQQDSELFSTLEYLLVGGDVLSPSHINMVKQRSPALHIINGYGPTENTTFSTTFFIRQEYKENIPIGKPITNSTAYIVDKNYNLQPIGIVGELLVGGDGVSRGYLNNPELTAERFLSIFYKSYMSYKTYISKKTYKTGDLARWLPDGNIQFLGRIDLQIKLRGFRIEPGEIENYLLKHEEISEAAVGVHQSNSGDKYLAAYLVSKADMEVSITGLREYLSNALPDYMIPSYFVQLAEMPLTPNGKLDRKALPLPELKAGVEYIAPRSEIQEKLAVIWAEVLGVDSAVGINDDFFALGGHSLKAALLTAKLHKAFNVKLPLIQIFKNPTIKKLAEYIRKAAENKYGAIKAVEKREYYLLSPAQRRLYILQQMDETGINENTAAAYNIPILLELEGVLQKQSLKEALKILITRHESLRTSFLILNGEPVQRIHDQVKFEIEYYNSGKQGDRETGDKKFPLSLSPSLPEHFKEFIRPFDLSQAPLCRVGLLELDRGKHILVIDMHHIISDGLSTGILAREFMDLYMGKELLPLKIQYKDYALWQNSKQEKEKLVQQEIWWTKEFSHEIPVLNLPLDYPRPSLQSFAGSRLFFETDAEELNACRNLALAGDATLYMVLLAAYSILLSRLSGQEEIVIGAPVAGRRHPDLEPIVGMFVNTLALKIYPKGNITCKEIVQQIKEKTLTAFENQEYPFEDLVDRVEVTRDASRNPLFDTAFILQNLEIPPLQVPGLKIIPYPYDNKIAKFDLTLQVFEETTSGEEKLKFILEYCTRLFKPETMQRVAVYFKKILSGITENPDEEISGIEIIPGAEKQKILQDFNATVFEYPCAETITQLFARQVEKTPDHVVLVGPHASHSKNYHMSDLSYMSYEVLYEQSRQLARCLSEEGVEPGTIVGIAAEPSPEMVIGIMGILKTGAAYLPIDPDYPKDRINYMLRDSSVGVLVTTAKLQFKADVEAKIINIEKLSSSSTLTLTSTLTSTCEVGPANLAYIIYTSGSTGRPKGVAVGHRSLVNLCYWHNRHFSITARDRATKLAGFGFDASVWEIFPYLIIGASLYLVEPGIRTDTLQLTAYFEKQQITVAFLPTQLCEQFITLQNRSLRLLLTGGDKLRKYSPTSYQLVNNYGPTENTVVTTSFLVTADSANIPIGSPIYNTRVYILDKHLQIQPIRVPGELCIAGDSLANGYLNNPELTAEKFFATNQKFLQGGPGGAVFSKSAPPGRRRQKIYKTGDLARWLEDGNIEFLGRTDQQVKIRGYRIELAEIENQLICHEEVKEAVVIDKTTGDDDKYLCAYIVPANESSGDLSVLKEYLSAQLPDYMVPAVVVPVEGIPLNPSGKVDRKALPEPGPGSTGSGYTAPRNPLEDQLVNIWQEVLGTKQPIGIDDDFFALGGHSLKATRLIARIHKQLNIKLPLGKIFKNPTIRGISRFAAGTGQNIYASIPQVEAKEYYPVSSAQKRMFILHQLKGHDTSDNTPYVVMAEGKLDKKYLKQVIKQLIKRHEPLRTSFHLLDETPVQRVHREVDFEIEYFLATESTENTESIIRNFIRPFDLVKPPLLRVGLVQLASQKYLFMHDIHHIIRDGTSSWIFFREFVELYRGNPLPPLRIHYKDFTVWQNRMLESAVIKNQEKYWLEVFPGEIPVLNMPIDFPRPAVQSFEGDYIEFALDPDQSRGIHELELSQGATLYMVLLSVYTILLSKYSGQEDIIVGTPIAGRPHADLENLIGMFVNTLAMRNFPEKTKTFSQFLEEVKNNALKAYENQDYQLETLVSRLGIPPNPARQSLFDTMFAVQNTRLDNLDPREYLIEGLTFKRIQFEENITQFDIMFHAYEGDDTIKFRLLYCTRLFKEETIRLLIRNFQEIIDTVTGNKDIQLKEIKITHGLFDRNIEVPETEFEF